MVKVARKSLCAEACSSMATTATCFWLAEASVRRCKVPLHCQLVQLSLLHGWVNPSLKDPTPSISQEKHTGIWGFPTLSGCSYPMQPFTKSKHKSLCSPSMHHAQKNQYFEENWASATQVSQFPGKLSPILLSLAPLLLPVIMQLGHCL